MADTKNEQTRSPRFWPSPQDYNEALQTPSFSFSDSELRSGIAEVDSLGLPRPNSGAFASVYKVRSGEKRYAVRCFLHNVRDISNRYQLISEYIQSDDLPYTVNFEYQEKGIFVRGEWFPILKMDWVEGKTLDQYLEEHLYQTSSLEHVCSEFVAMCKALERCGIAHGDLQHGNIMVTPDGQLRLVDYDGFFVPSMSQLNANELGHRNYQHPSRAANHFGPYLDNFSAWVIYTSLRAVIHCPNLYRELGGGQECLLFRHEDFIYPEESKPIVALLDADGPCVSSVNTLLYLLYRSPDTTVALGEEAPLSVPFIAGASVTGSEWYREHCTENASVIDAPPAPVAVDTAVGVRPKHRVIDRTGAEEPNWPAVLFGVLMWWLLSLGLLGWPQGTWVAVVGTMLAMVVSIARTMAYSHQMEVVRGLSSGKSKELLRTGYVATATISEKNSKVTHGHYVRYLRYYFKSYNGTIVHGQMIVDWHLWETILPGEEAVAYYDARCPTDNILAGFS